MTTCIGTDGVQRASAIPNFALFNWKTGFLTEWPYTEADRFDALGGSDTIIADPGNAIILAGSGTDLIDGRGGFARMDGGAGIDTLDAFWLTTAYIWNMATGVTNSTAQGERALNFEIAITGSGNDAVTPAPPAAIPSVPISALTGSTQAAAMMSCRAGSAMTP